MLYEGQFKKIKHFELHEELIPYVGENYDKYRILLIGESHYLPKDTSLTINDFANWYEESTSKIIESDAHGYFNTKTVIQDYIDINRSRVYSMYRRPSEVLNELVTIKTEHPFSYFSYMNYFQRPELLNGMSFDGNKDDFKNAMEVTNRVIEILKPELIVFLSKKAFERYKNSMSNDISDKIKRVAHPTCAWWIRKTENGTGTCGKDEFRRFLEVIIHK